MSSSNQDAGGGWCHDAERGQVMLADKKQSEGSNEWEAEKQSEAVAHLVELASGEVGAGQLRVTEVNSSFEFLVQQHSSTDAPLVTREKIRE